METKSRTEYSARNTTVAVISRFSAIFMGFILRIVFTHTLSESYVGVNGLFLDIVNILSLTEMGVGTAITYALYRPIEEQDIEKQKSLMKLYCKFYRIVAVIVTIIGVAIIPFMDYLIKDQPDVDHLIFIYILYLTNTVSSYLLIYKRTLLDAHQLSYIGTIYQTSSWIIQDVIQMAILLFTRNFILYLLVNLLTTVICNVCISRRADRMYPYLKDKDVAPLSKSEQRDIFKNIKAMLMHKIGTVVVNNTDNLLISAFVGIVSVGMYSNYYLVIGSIKQVLEQVFQGITASVGNLGVTSDEKRVKKVFEASFFLCHWLYGFSAICLYELLNPFVELSFGANYVFTRNIVLMLCMNFFITGMRNASLVFRDSLGLFWYDRYKSIIEAVLNLVISIILVQHLGTAGVFLGTIISTLLTSAWVEPYVLYKYRIKSSCLDYFWHYGIYCCVVAGSWYLTSRLCSLYHGGLIMTLIVRLLICCIVPNLIMLICYCQTREFQFLWDKAVLVYQSKKKSR